MKPDSYKHRIDEKFEQIGFGGMDEKSILKKLRNRDEKAFEEIIDLYSASYTMQDIQKKLDTIVRKINWMKK